MTVINYSNARKNFKSLIEKVNNDQEAITITSKKYNAVLISESAYNQYVETMYLLSNPSNAKRLSESINQLQEGQMINLDE